MTRHIRQHIAELRLIPEGAAESPGFLMAKLAADGQLPPMTHEESVAFECQKAAIRAEDDRKREPTPQLEFAA